MEKTLDQLQAEVISTAGKGYLILLSGVIVFFVLTILSFALQSDNLLPLAISLWCTAYSKRIKDRIRSGAGKQKT